MSIYFFACWAILHASFMIVFFFSFFKNFFQEYQQNVKQFGSRLGLTICQTGTEVIKLFSCSTQLSTKCTIVCILEFISMINKISEKLKARNFICQYFSFYEQLKFCAQLS